MVGGKLLVGSSSPLLQLAEEIARLHHERWDGGGYGGLAGVAIPVSARMMTVADSFDVISSERPYRSVQTVEEAAIEIERGSGTQFDPAVVEAFLEVQGKSNPLPIARRRSG